MLKPLGQPDLIFPAVNDSATLGNDVYEAWPSTQQESISAPPRGVARIPITIQNDGRKSGSITVSGEASNAHLSVRYLAGL